MRLLQILQQLPQAGESIGVIITIWLCLPLLAIA